MRRISAAGKKLQFGIRNIGFRDSQLRSRQPDDTTLDTRIVVIEADRIGFPRLVGFAPIHAGIAMGLYPVMDRVIALRNDIFTGCFGAPVRCVISEFRPQCVKLEIGGVLDDKVTARRMEILTQKDGFRDFQAYLHIGIIMDVLIEYLIVYPIRLVIVLNVKFVEIGRIIFVIQIIGIIQKAQTPLYLGRRFTEFQRIPVKKQLHRFVPSVIEGRIVDVNGNPVSLFGRTGYGKISD